MITNALVTSSCPACPCVHHHCRGRCCVWGRVQIEAMVPFASPHPTPASERRRVRSAKTFLFSITAGRNGTYANFVAGTGGGGGVSGATQRPAAAPAVAPRSGVSNRCRSSSSGEEDWARYRYRYHPSSLEEQLYAGLGALLEVSACCIRVEPLRERLWTQHEISFFSFFTKPKALYFSLENKPKLTSIFHTKPNQKQPLSTGRSCFSSHRQDCCFSISTQGRLKALPYFEVLQRGSLKC